MFTQTARGRIDSACYLSDGGLEIFAGPIGSE